MVRNKKLLLKNISQLKAEKYTEILVKRKINKTSIKLNKISKLQTQSLVKAHSMIVILVISQLSQHMIDKKRLKFLIKSQPKGRLRKVCDLFDSKAISQINTNRMNLFM